MSLAEGITSRFLQAIDLTAAHRGQKVKDLLENTGIDNRYVSALRTKPGTAIGSDKVAMLYEQFQISPLWIIAGQGPMVLDGAAPSDILQQILQEVQKVRELQGDVLGPLIASMIKLELKPADPVKHMLKEAEKRFKSS